MIKLSSGVSGSEQNEYKHHLLSYSAEVMKL